MFHPEPLKSAVGEPDLGFPNQTPLQLFPVRDFLANSAYYPAAGTDFWPVLALAEHCRTFVYADYCVSSKDAVAALKRLHPSSLQDVSREALLPEGTWQPNHEETCSKGFPYAKPFALLARFRVAGRTGQRQAGAIRFSFPGSPGLDDPEVQLLYLGGEGVACYDALYVAQGVAPKVLTILRPGTGFGFNWTDFRATGDSLEMAVARNRGGIPRGLLRDADELHMGYQWPELRLATCFGQKPGDSAVSPVLEWRRKS